ncbi:ankyrin repeat domain-containing protein [Thiotrichales bacterium 19X7-9]|nr:ankyrin repeat domain-containing protein [Thiotrichales bacterium 19X7-9]
MKYEELASLIRSGKDNIRVIKEIDSVDKTIDQDGNTFLHLAAKARNIQLVSFLLDIGQDINAQNKQGHAPIHIAIINKDKALFNLLVSRRNINLAIYDRNGCHLLEYAILLGDQEIYQMLREQFKNRYSKKEGVNGFKFPQVFYLSFQGDNEHSLSYRQSVFYQSDQNHHQQATIKLCTERPRKLNPNENVSLIQINYPFQNNLPSKWHVSKSQSNKEVAYQLAYKVLMTAQPGTRIYLDIHSSSGLSYFWQNIKRPIKKGSEIIKVNIMPDEIADLLDRTLPIQAKNNLQIVSLACQSISASLELLKCLHQRGFKRTSVVASNVSVMIIPDYTKSEYEILDAFHCTSNKHQKDYKIVFHNYNGVLEAEDPLIFKNRYLQQSSYASQSLYSDNGIIDKESQLLQERIRSETRCYQLFGECSLPPLLFNPRTNFDKGQDGLSFQS